MKIGRAELYTSVWNTPMTKLAAEFGVSDVGLAKICRRNYVPIPAAGHWAKLKYGKIVNQPPLPKSDIETVEIKRAHLQREKKSKSNEKVFELAPVQDSSSDVRLSPIVRETYKRLMASRQNYKGFIAVSGDGVFDCCVEKGAEKLSCLILEAICNRVLELGGGVSSESGAVGLYLDGVVIKLKIAQRKTPSRLESFDIGAAKENVRSAEEGEAIFVMAIKNENYKGRKRWVESRKFPLRKDVGRFVLELRHVAKKIKIYERELKAWRMRLDEEIKNEKEIERKNAEELAFELQLIAEAVVSNKIRSLEKYLSRLLDELEKSNLQLSEHARHWLVAAQKTIKELDPIDGRVAWLLANR